MEERLPKGALGGQAVIEGVMMKGKDSYSIAIRKPDRKIEVKLQKHQSFGEKHTFARIPFIRGVVNFAESMVVGMKTLSYSSSFYEEEEEETKADKFIKDVFKEKAESVIIGITLMLSVVLAIALFMMLPAAIGEFIGKWVDNRILLSLIEGIIRLIIFIIYVVLISQMEDIRRVFMYHGAEHKTINCYEAGEDLTPQNVAKHSRYHKRCGTSFLFIVMVFSIVIFMFITADQMWLRFLLRLLLIPVVAGISYEFIRLAGRSENAVMNILSKPGMWIQKLTTKEPEEEMIQVAIIAVESVLYGKDYADAVNEAQGLGKKENESAYNEEESLLQTDGEDDEFKEMLDDVFEDVEAFNETADYSEVEGYTGTMSSLDEEMLQDDTEEFIEAEQDELVESVDDEVAQEEFAELAGDEIAQEESAELVDNEIAQENSVENVDEEIQQEGLVENIDDMTK